MSGSKKEELKGKRENYIMESATNLPLAKYY
jgi:hypothetical protein